MKNQENFSNELKNAQEGDQVTVVIKSKRIVDIERIFGGLHFRKKIILKDLLFKLDIFTFHEIESWMNKFWTDKAKTELKFSFTINNIPFTKNEISKISSIISEMVIVHP